MFAEFTLYRALNAIPWDIEEIVNRSYLHTGNPVEDELARFGPQGFDAYFASAGRPVSAGREDKHLFALAKANLGRGEFFVHHRRTYFRPRGKALAAVLAHLSPSNSAETSLRELFETVKKDEELWIEYAPLGT